MSLTGVSVRKRSVAMVYQEFVNYPGFTVFDNIASPLKVAGVDGAGRGAAHGSASGSSSA